MVGNKVYHQYNTNSYSKTDNLENYAEVVTRRMRGLQMGHTLYHPIMGRKWWHVQTKYQRFLYCNWFESLHNEFYSVRLMRSAAKQVLVKGA